MDDDPGASSSLPLMLGAGIGGIALLALALVLVAIRRHRRVQLAPPADDNRSPPLGTGTKTAESRAREVNGDSVLFGYNEAPMRLTGRQPVLAVRSLAPNGLQSPHGDGLQSTYNAPVLQLHRRAGMDTYVV